MVTLADKNLHEIGYVKDANFTADVNGEYEFSVQIARSNWYPELNFSSYIYIVGTEYGGIIGEILTDTTLDYVEVKGITWRGFLPSMWTGSSERAQPRPLPSQKKMGWSLPSCNPAAPAAA